MDQYNELVCVASQVFLGQKGEILRTCVLYKLINTNKKTLLGSVRQANGGSFVHNIPVCRHSMQFGIMHCSRVS